MSRNKEKKDNTVIIAIIGLVGTLLAGLLASPFLPQLLGQETPVTEVVTTVVVTSEGNDNTPLIRRENMVFSNDFSNNNTSGFAFGNGNWQITKEKNNPLLEMSGSGENNDPAVFGPNDFKDGRILFRVNYQHFGDVFLNFRTESMQTYSLLLSPAAGTISLGYASNAGGWSLEAFGGNSVRAFQFIEDNWYDVKLEAVGEGFTVWIDENKILTASDMRLAVGSMEISVGGDATLWFDDFEVWQYTYEQQ